MRPLAKTRGGTQLLPCTLDVEQTFDSLHAHVELEGVNDICPGDEITVQGERVEVAFGEKFTLHRQATLRRAGPLESLWMRIKGDLEVLDLLD